MCNQCLERNPRHLDRRRMLRAFAAGLVAATAPAAFTRAANPPTHGITPDAALKRLMVGHQAYLDGKASAGAYGAGRAGRAAGQSPIAAVLSCADSRVLPELIFDQKPGEMFVVRVAGNVESAEGIASLEYGAQFLGIPLIMVMGHSACGAVDAAIKVYRDRIALPGHLPNLIDLIVPAVRAAEAQKPADLLAASIVQNVRNTVANIASTGPVLAPMVKAGSVKVVGSVYDVGSGRVTLV